KIMFPKGKGSAVPSDGQAREKLALYVYEYLLHIGAQKSAQTFLSEIRWEKNITLGEPPGFLHSWWCVFWDLYCAAPERRETCDHSSEAKAFHDYVSSAPPHVAGSFMNPRFAAGPRGPPIRMGNQPPGGGPGTHLMLQNMDHTRPQGHPNLGPMQRMSGPRGMGPMGPGPQNFGGGMRPPHNAMGPGMPGVNMMGPGAGRPWPNPNNGNSGGSGGGGPTGTPVMPSPAGSACLPLQFPMGPGSDGPLGAMAGMEPHHMNGSLGSGDMDGLNKNSPNHLSGISNPPGTPRDGDELGGNFLHSFQSENVSPLLTMQYKTFSCFLV
uniref:Single stranded DNA binding protein 3b n=1 Tax=Salmo trutta TaxID=8032 RepID=A0A674CT85_SALTR